MRGVQPEVHEDRRFDAVRPGIDGGISRPARPAIATIGAPPAACATPNSRPEPTIAAIARAPHDPLADEACPARSPSSGSWINERKNLPSATHVRNRLFTRKSAVCAGAFSSKRTHPQATATPNTTTALKVKPTTVSVAKRPAASPRRNLGASSATRQPRPIPCRSSGTL